MILVAFDPLSFVIGVPILGPVLAWALYELHNLNEKLLVLMRENSEAQRTLASTIATRIETDRNLKEAVEKTQDSVQRLADTITNALLSPPRGRH